MTVVADVARAGGVEGVFQLLRLLFGTIHHQLFQRVGVGGEDAQITQSQTLCQLSTYAITKFIKTGMGRIHGYAVAYQLVDNASRGTVGVDALEARENKRVMGYDKVAAGFHSFVNYGLGEVEGDKHASDFG